jgi:hypothetical protein
MALFLLIPYAILFAFAITELGLVSSMVAFLHIQKTDVGQYSVLFPPYSTNDNSDTFILDALPPNLWLDQGHTTNGAAGWAFAVSVAGIAAVLSMRYLSLQTLSHRVCHLHSLGLSAPVMQTFPESHTQLI